MDKTVLKLKSGVTLAELGGQTGLVLQERVRFAADTRQAEILRVLVHRPQTVESLLALLHARDRPPESDHRISLDLAKFILDFGEFLES
ncbi:MULTISPECIES: hypothetical protein [unclassified Oscillibacter]|uniref:hypothetical protein n=1 Tax=unclassified Oscillibacter TaxID=2629304 RepID=UPI0025D2F30B|nr:MULTISPECIES: hypothetical protein [unclassified Oscillibacter]